MAHHHVSLKAICWGLMVVLLLPFMACNGPTQIAINEITANPPKYEGQKVLIKGEYRGWEAGHGSPPVTRSDWILKDNTDCLYVCGKVMLDPTRDVGKKITVYGTVKIKAGKAYIEADFVK